VIDRLPQLGTVGFQLLLPSGHGRRFASGLGLLSGWLLGESTTFQLGLGLGLGSGLPGGSSNGRPFLVAVVKASSCWYSAAIWLASARAFAAWAWSCRVAASAACRQASASAWAVSRS
jgi:hypothetical protein